MSGTKNSINLGYEFGNECLKTIDVLKAKLAAVTLELEITKNKLRMFKSYGSTDCFKCETGRISIFTANTECMKCNPRSYDIPQTPKEKP